MKLNVDCIRDVMLAVEAFPFGAKVTLDAFAKTMPQYSKSEIHYTCLKLQEGGYLNASVVTFFNSSPRIATIQDLTYNGHKLLDNIRNDTVFKKAKSKIIGTVGTASLEILSAVAGSLVSEILGL